MTLGPLSATPPLSSDIYIWSWHFW
jgi:hypothetical protein